MTIHWCGTGLSAIPGLRRLISDGHEVTVWNRTLDKAEDAVGDLTQRLHEFEMEALRAEVQPGDVVVFNGRIVHGGSGNLAPDRDLKVFNTQWLGDDVRVLFRPEGMSPDHSAAMTEVGLSSGDRIGTDLYPQLWRREPANA